MFTPISNNCFIHSEFFPIRSKKRYHEDKISSVNESALINYKIDDIALSIIMLPAHSCAAGKKKKKDFRK